MATGWSLISSEHKGQAGRRSVVLAEETGYVPGELSYLDESATTGTSADRGTDPSGINSQPVRAGRSGRRPG